MKGAFAKPFSTGKTWSCTACCARNTSVILGKMIVEELTSELELLRSRLQHRKEKD
jgi:hypothetical protein